MFAFKENQHHKPLHCLMDRSIFFFQASRVLMDPGEKSQYFSPMSTALWNNAKEIRQTFMLTIEAKYLNFNIHTIRTQSSQNYPVYLYTLSYLCKHLSFCLFRNLTQTKVHWSNTLKTTGKGKYYC